jgi:tetratricopeptide (TPR) repeat protein
MLGQYDKALAENREALSLNPNGEGYSDLLLIYLGENRLNEAWAAAADAQAKGLDSPDLRLLLYKVDFCLNNSEGMTQLVAWGSGKPHVEYELLNLQADTSAYYGQLAEARQLSQRAVVFAERENAKETAARILAYAALREALFGYQAEAHHHAEQALARSTSRLVQYLAALTFAFAGDAPKAEYIADNLAKRFPDDTVVQFDYLPSVRAQIAILRNDPFKGVEFLEISVPYELGFQAQMYPAYVRGLVFLAAGHGRESATEFQKLSQHCGLVSIQPTGSLVRLQLARAYAMQGDTAKSRAAYQDFLTLWKDADPDIPIYKQAKAEYANP